MPAAALSVLPGWGLESAGPRRKNVPQEGSSTRSIFCADIPAGPGPTRGRPAKTLADFDFNFNPKLPASQIRDLATGRYLQHHESVLICGPVGVGKSHIAQALGHTACLQGHDVRHVKTIRVLADLGGGQVDGIWEVRLRRYLQPDLLVLDDFGLRDFTPLQAEDLYELIRERDRDGSLIVVSNRAPGDWYPLFPNPVLAEGAPDRRINGAHHVVMTGRSYRPLRRPERGDGAAPSAAMASHESGEEAATQA